MGDTAKMRSQYSGASARKTITRKKSSKKKAVANKPPARKAAAKKTPVRRQVAQKTATHSLTLQAKGGGAERRSDERYDVDGLLEVDIELFGYQRDGRPFGIGRTPNAPEKIHSVGHTVNLSVSGLLAHVTDMIVDGSNCLVRFVTTDDSVRPQLRWGVVVRSGELESGKYEIAIRFDSPIDEGTEITMAGRRWTIRIGHGHAPAHATFWSINDPSADSLVLAGDQVIPGISSNISVYPTEPDADPLGDWLESCQRLRTHARPGHLVLPGHKLPFRGLAFRLTQLIENHTHALARIEASLSKGPLTAAECFPAIFKRPIGDSEYGLALGEAVAHMNHLHRAGRLSRDMDSAGAWRYRIAEL